MKYGTAVTFAISTPNQCNSLQAIYCRLFIPLYPTFDWLVTKDIWADHIFLELSRQSRSLAGNSNPRTTRPPIKSSDCRLSNPTRKGKKPTRDKYLKHEDIHIFIYDAVSANVMI